VELVDDLSSRVAAHDELGDLGLATREAMRKQHDGKCFGGARRLEHDGDPAVLSAEVSGVKGEPASCRRVRVEIFAEREVSPRT
jgi:hypothetical protein